MIMWKIRFKYDDPDKQTATYFLFLFFEFDLDIYFSKSNPIKMFGD
jgi:hypothetical protein